MSYSESVFRNERRIGIAAKWLLLALGLVSTRFAETYQASIWLAVGTLGYALMTLALTVSVNLMGGTARRSSRLVLLASYAADIAFVSLIVRYGADFSRELYLLYALLALRGALYYPIWPEVVALPVSLGIVYVLVLRVSLGSWYFLGEPSFLLRYAVLFSVVLASIYLGWLNDQSRVRETRLRQSLAERTEDLDVKTRATQQMAANLGDRVLELRTLQEGIKAITSSLALEDVLRLIVANASQVLEGARCSATLLDDRGGAVSTASADWRSGSASRSGVDFDREAAAWVVQAGKPLLVRGVEEDQLLGLAKGLPVAALISAPLFLGDQAIGALIATSSDQRAFGDEDLSLLSAFADQAAAAVSNARLYEQLAEEQKQTAQLYQHVEERRKELEAILRGIGDGVIVADPSLNLLLMNPIATRIFRVKPDVTSSLPLSEIVPHEELGTLLQEALQGEEEAIVREITLAPVDRASQAGDTAGPADSGQRGPTAEEEAIYQALASPIVGTDGQVRGVVTVLRDITSQKELERMKSNFLSVVSHELKTPLNSIKGFVEIILMGKTGPISETQADFLGTVRDQTSHLQNLIDDLLEFSRLDSGQVKLRLTEVSLTEVAQAVLSKLKPLADREQLQLVIDMPGDIATVQADRIRIEQVLTNLVHNAVKFTPPSGRVTISGLDLGEHIRVAVTDTGIGIPKPELGRVFDRFYQVDSSSTRHYRGTGLGLTISKHIIEYHQGRIWAESEEGEGSTFFFLLPKHIGGETDELLLDFMTLPDREDG